MKLAHLKLLKSGKKTWRAWRKENPDIVPDLSGASLVGLRDLSYLDFSGANLSGCNARFVRFSSSKFVGANLSGADLRAASLRRADLRNADLRKAVLRFTSLVGARVGGADFRRAEVYGVNAWNLEGVPKHQTRLIIRENNDAGTVTTEADDMGTAQYLFMLRENDQIPNIIDTASLRTVLLLGRFEPASRMEVLEGIKARLLRRGFVPILFDFEKPESRDLTETVATLAHMACFVIADLTAARSLPQELSHIVPFLPSVPIVPILARSDQQAYSMFEHFLRYPWVSRPARYEDLNELLSFINRRIIDAGWKRAMKLRRNRSAELPR